MNHDLLRRYQATEATLKKFRGKVFDWNAAMHCAALLRFHLKKAGHTVEPLPKMRSAAVARAELKKRGVDNMAGLCRDWLKLEPIAPAAMLMGDLAVGGSEDGLGGILICAGPHKVFGWREDEPRLVVLDLEFGELELAFRI